jgi:hypothetical protein
MMEVIWDFSGAVSSGHSGVQRLAAKVTLTAGTAQSFRMLHLQTSATKVSVRDAEPAGEGFQVELA